MSEEIGFVQRPLPAWMKMLDSVVRRMGLDGRALTPERLMEEAARDAGLPGDFPPWVVETLEVLCLSLREEAHLHGFGALNVRTLLISGLSTLLRIEDLFARRPELHQVPLNAPVVVTGLPRSGTTYLHRLLAAVEEAAPVSLWQHTYPLPPAGPDLRRLRAELDFLPWRMASRLYQIDAMHLVRPTLPDECNFGMRLGGRSMIYWATAPTYRYLEWLLAQDLRESYALYRKALILHQLAAPGRRLTLKCPHHLAWLPALREALPEALLVVTHRDPLETVPSECKLIVSLQALATSRLDWRRTVAGNALKIQVFSQRLLDFSASADQQRLVHVPYRRLLKDPVGLVRDIHGRFDLPFGEGHAALIQGFAAENRQHKHGKNPYSAAQFGLSLEELAREHAAYRGHFADEISRA